MNAMSAVRDYYADVELHAKIAIDIFVRYPEAVHSTHWMIDDEIAFRAPLLSEKFLQDIDVVETDLRRCISKLMRLE